MRPTAAKVTAALTALVLVAGFLETPPAPVHASGAVITEFGPTGFSPMDITTGADGNVWYSYSSGIGRITPTGLVTEFAVSLPAGANPASIAAGPDGNLWFTEWQANQVGRITPGGVITEFPLPVMAVDIVGGPDGNLWLASPTIGIGRMTLAGVVTWFPLSSTSGAVGIALGPDGNLWFTDQPANEIGRITPSGTITKYPVPTEASRPTDITRGPDGNLWFTETGPDVNQVGRITTTGIVAEYPIPSFAWYIAAGPDGALWFPEPTANQLGRISTSGVVTEIPVPTANSSPLGVAAGPDGNIWFTEAGVGQIGRLSLAEAPMSPPVSGPVSPPVSPPVSGPVGTPSPTISSLDPRDGPFNGGTPVTIAGSGFVAGETTVTFGGVPGTEVTVTSPNKLTVKPPALPQPYATAQYVDVQVATPSGSKSLANGYTYRGVAAFFIRGMNSQYPRADRLEDEFLQPGGIGEFLNSQGWPAEALLNYSYVGGDFDSTGRWVATPYNGPQSLAQSIRVDASKLRLQVLDYLARYPETDIYLIGHSQGGTIAFAYLADLFVRFENPARLGAGGRGRLAAVVTLDSPVGGMPYFPSDNSTFGSLADMKKVWESGVGAPAGSTRSLVTLFGLKGLTNQWLAANAAHVSGVRILTVGNRKDWAFGRYWGLTPSSVDPFLDTQWLLSEGEGSGVYARAIDQGDSACPSTDLLLLCNHRLVLTDEGVKQAIVNLAEDRPVGLSLPPDQAVVISSTSSDPAGSTTATVGTYLSATAAGTGTVTAAVLPSGLDLGLPTLFGAGGSYFDVRVSPDSQFSSVSIKDCRTGGATVASWWNSKRERWVEASSQSYDAATGCITITVNNSTSPTLNDLTGTVFGVGLTPPPAPVAPPAPPSGGVAGPISVPGVNGLYSISVAAGTEVILVDPFGPGTSITVKFTSAVTGTILVTPLTALPAGVGAPPGASVVALFNVELGGGVTNAAISSVTYRFPAAASLTNVALQRFADGAWATLAATQVSVSGDRATYEASSGGFSVYAITGTPAAATVVARGAAASALGVRRAGFFSTSTKVPALGTYATVRFSLGAAYAGKTIGIWAATKGSTGVWSTFSRLTSRIADASGNVYYFVRSSSAAWKSFRAAFDGGGSLAAKATVSAQVRWR